MSEKACLVSLLGRSTAGFRSDSRFTPRSEAKPPEPPAEDPLAIAYSEGFAAGIDQACAEAEAHAAAEAEARTGLALSISRLDAEMAEALRQRLEETVIALCEATLAPLALDRDALAARVERAVAMFTRANDERVIRLNPEDAALLAPRMAADWTLLPDSALERGALRIETASGGLEDGPEQWRRAIIEALRAC